MTTKQFSLDQITSNPYQVRLAEDPEHVTKVALSIAHSGLLQTPVGRVDPLDGSRVELAFGHTRLAAYRQLRDEDVAAGGDGSPWRELPVDVRELTDLELFELAIRENIDRKDLSPIEEARAMATYRDEFKRTSTQIGELFGLNDSTVRNRMRLLELPVPVQERVEAGDITEGTARKLLTVQKLVPKRIEEVAAGLVKGNYQGDALDDQLSEVMEEAGWRLCEERNGALPTAGNGLWKLDWKGPVTNPTGAGVIQALGDRKVKPEVLEQAVAAASSGTDVAGLVELFGIFEPAAAIIRQLVAPPACSACEFHQVLNGVHYCGLKACWDRKKTAWIASETRRVAKKLGVPVYDAKADGRTVLSAPGEWTGDYSKQRLHGSWEKLLKAKDASLRVRGKFSKYSFSDHPGTGSPVVELIRVGKPAEKAKDDEKRRQHTTYNYEAEHKKREEEDRRARAAQAFIGSIAAPIFADVLAPYEQPEALRMILAAIEGAWGERRRKLPDKPAARLLALRSILASRILERALEYSDLRKGPESVAGHLVGVAKTLGVKLPKHWQEAAASFAPKAQAVSTETGGAEEESEDDE